MHRLGFYAQPLENMEQLAERNAPCSFVTRRNGEVAQLANLIITATLYMLIFSRATIAMQHFVTLDVVDCFMVVRANGRNLSFYAQLLEEMEQLVERNAHKPCRTPAWLIRDATKRWSRPIGLVST